MEYSIKSNLEKVTYLIDEAKSKSPYKQDVTLVAVSKTVDVDKISEVVDFGIVNFGENKPQELVRKYEVYPDLKWHQIGTLQTNKVKHIVDKAFLIHSLDSISLASEIDKRAKAKDIIVPCLVQINISDEDTKHGIKQNQLESFMRQVSESCTSIKLCGLMGMAPYEVDAENTRPYFQKMKELLEYVNSKNINSIKLEHLSMGMSNDFHIAIQEGSTIVRIGTTIFGQRVYI